MLHKHQWEDWVVLPDDMRYRCAACGVVRTGKERIRIAKLNAEINKAENRRVEVCSVCTGDNMPNCICGGTGTADGELHGLRVECFRLRGLLEQDDGATEWTTEYAHKVAEDATLHQIDNVMQMEFKTAYVDGTRWIYADSAAAEIYRKELRYLDLRGLLEYYPTDSKLMRPRK